MSYSYFVEAGYGFRLSDAFEGLSHSTIEALMPEAVSAISFGLDSTDFYAVATESRYAVEARDLHEPRSYSPGELSAFNLLLWPLFREYGAPNATLGLLVGASAC